MKLLIQFVSYQILLVSIVDLQFKLFYTFNLSITTPIKRHGYVYNNSGIKPMCTGWRL